MGTGKVLPGVSHPVLCYLVIILYMASTSWSKGQHLHSRKQKEEATKERLRERERNAKGIHNISAYIQLAGTKVHGHTQLQGTLGNVVLVIAAMCPTRNPVTMKEWRNGYPGVSGSLCHNVYATLLNRITETVEYRLQALKMTVG